MDVWLDVKCITWNTYILVDKDLDLVLNELSTRVVVEDVLSR